MTNSCPFCSFIAADSSNCILRPNDRAVAVRDGYPLTKGHSLIIIKRHVSSVFSIETDDWAALFSLLRQMKSELDAEYSPDSYNIGINDGPEAGQTIDHLHIHLIPRYEGDIPIPRGGVRWIIPEKAIYWTDTE